MTETEIQIISGNGNRILETTWKNQALYRIISDI